MSFEEEEAALPEEEDADEPAPEVCSDVDVMKGNCHFLISGDPPIDHSPFATPSKKPKWPDGLWKSGTQVYDILDGSKCVPPAESRSDRCLRFDSGVLPERVCDLSSVEGLTSNPA
jgi:hypothetical protein